MSRQRHITAIIFTQQGGSALNTPWIEATYEQSGKWRNPRTSCKETINLHPPALLRGQPHLPQASWTSGMCWLIWYRVSQVNMGCSVDIFSNNRKQLFDRIGRMHLHNDPPAPCPLQSTFHLHKHYYHQYFDHFLHVWLVDSEEERLRVGKHTWLRFGNRRQGVHGSARIQSVACLHILLHWSQNSYGAQIDVHDSPKQTSPY